MSRRSCLTMTWLFISFSLVLTACAAPASKQNKRADDPREAAEVNVQLGRRYMEDGKLELAMEKLTKALQYDPNIADGHTVIAVLYERLGDAKNAEEHYKRAAGLTPKNGAVNNNYGAFLCKVHKFDLSQKYFERAIADPFYKTPEVAYANAGMCLLLAGKPEMAEGNFRKALEVNPNNSDALYQLSIVLYQKNDYFHARAFLQRYENLSQPSAAALHLGHEIELKLGNAAAARDYAKRLHDQFPDSEQARGLTDGSS